MNADHFPTFRRFFRSVRSFLSTGLLLLRRLILNRRLVIVCLTVFLVGWLAVFIDGWTGRRAWTAEEARLAAAGESFEVKPILTPRPPDAENFFAIPELAFPGKPRTIADDVDDPFTPALWLASQVVVRDDRGHPVRNKSGRVLRGEYRFNGDPLTAPLAELCAHFRKKGMLPREPLDSSPAKELLLSAQQKWGPRLGALYTASSRPSAVVLPSPLERVTAGEDPDGPDNAFTLLKSLPAIVVHARAAVEAGDGQLAEKDLHVLTKFETGLLQDGRLSSLVQAATVRRGQLEVLRQGIKRHLWTPPQLDALAAGSDPSAVWPHVRTTLAIERYTVCQWLLHAPPGTLELSPRSGSGAELGSPLERMGDVYLRHFPEGFALRQCAARSREYSQCLDQLPAAAPLDGWPLHLKKLEAACAAEYSPLTGTVRNLLSIWDARRFVFITCALERHYLGHGRYAAALTGLSPALPAELLPDTDGQPLRYLTPPGGAEFRVWSVGWDCKENSGTKNSDDVVFSVE